MGKLREKGLNSALQSPVGTGGEGHSLGKTLSSQILDNMGARALGAPKNLLDHVPSKSWKTSSRARYREDSVHVIQDSDVTLESYLRRPQNCGARQPMGGRMADEMGPPSRKSATKRLPDRNRPQECCARAPRAVGNARKNRAEMYGHARCREHGSQCLM